MTLVTKNANPGQRLNIAGLRLSKFSVAYVLTKVNPDEIAVGNVCVLYDSHLNPLQYNGEKLLYVTGIDECAELQVDGSTDVNLTVIPYVPTKAVSTLDLPPYQNSPVTHDNLITMDMFLSVEDDLVKVHDITLLSTFNPYSLPSISDFVIVRSDSGNGGFEHKSLNLQILFLQITSSDSYASKDPPCGLPYQAKVTVSGGEPIYQMLKSLADHGALYLRLRGYTGFPEIPSLP